MFRNRDCIGVFLALLVYIPNIILPFTFNRPSSFWLTATSVATTSASSTGTGSPVPTYNGSTGSLSQAWASSTRSSSTLGVS